ncbi:uncharacterized protein BP5553_01713 [Venustampulla echinocandica]|uniref:PPPDE domain-containing protein n=1 Tax=Venustampulla echinocandica TaxID=2656787 RepID=A0A370U1T1_9HELO|nr:uncharacterized protein BP5553_01713 [Venustampulla echinocandica]RDL41734.1 hypothetical protein BP5553_01713 [Venustampulla echinocandica]
MKFQITFSALLYTLLQIQSALANRGYDVLNAVYQKAHPGQNMAANQRYVFVEKYQGGSTDMEQCVAGYTHVAVVVGSVIHTGHDQHFFQGTMYHLTTQGDRIFNYGDPIEIPMVPDWSPRTYRVATVTLYKGTTTAEDSTIKNLRDQYLREHAKYSLRSNNCNSFAEWMTSKIVS